jgi:hypothetical protein
MSTGCEIVRSIGGLATLDAQLLTAVRRSDAAVFSALSLSK